MMGFRAALIAADHPHSGPLLQTLLEIHQVDSITVCHPGGPEPDFDVPADAGKTVELVDSLDSVLEIRPDLVLVAMPPDISPAMCRRVLEAGIPCLSEKPAARTAAETAELADLAVTRRVPFSALYCYRHNSQLLKARELISSGVIGRPTSVEARFITSRPGYRDTGHWTFDSARSGGGILQWLGCHSLDALMYLLDEDIRDISMMAGTNSGEPIDVEDVAVLNFRMSSGVLGGLQLGYELAGGAEGFVGNAKDRNFIIRGTGGQLSWNSGTDPERLYLEVPAAENEVEKTTVLDCPAPGSGGYAGADGLAFISAFINHIGDQNQNGTPMSPAEIRRLSEVIADAYLSAGLRTRKDQHKEV